MKKAQKTRKQKLANGDDGCSSSCSSSCSSGSVSSYNSDDQYYGTKKNYRYTRDYSEYNNSSDIWDDKRKIQLLKETYKLIDKCFIKF